MAILDRALTPRRRRSIYPLRKHIVIKSGKNPKTRDSSPLSEVLLEEGSIEEEELQPGAAESETNEVDKLTDWQRRRIDELRKQSRSSRRPTLRRPVPYRPGHFRASEEAPNGQVPREQSANTKSLVEVEQEHVEGDNEGEERAKDAMELHKGATQHWCETVGTKRRRLNIDF